MDLLRQYEHTQRDQERKPRNAYPQDSARSDERPPICLFILRALSLSPAAQFPELTLAKSDPLPDQPDRVVKPHGITEYKIK